MPTKETAEEIKAGIVELLQDNNSDTRLLYKKIGQLSKLDVHYQRFAIDAKTIIHLGRDSIKDHTTALIELVKNSYDADAKNVDVEVFCSNGNDIIRVSDNGFGMTRDSLVNNWLRIGYSNKRESKLSELGRRKTGEKGIGRISTDRLGAKIELRTKTEEDGIIGLNLNWDEFDVEGKDIFDINIELITPDAIQIPNSEGLPSRSGTEIIITSLRQKWTTENIRNLYNELALLTPPFDDVKDFRIKLKNDVSDLFSGDVSSEFYKTAEIELDTVFDNTNELVIYTIKNKYSDKEYTETIKWQQMLEKIDYSSVDSAPELKLGPVAIKLMFFLREAASVADSELTLKDLRSFLDSNAGIKVYRDNFAVKPYGFSSAQFGYDWLELGDRKSRNPAGISRGEEYMVNPNQLIGAVYITRDKNPLLVDSAAREGLIESEAFNDLKLLVMGSIRMLESHRASLLPEIQKVRKEKKKNPTSKEVEHIQSQIKEVTDGLQGMKAAIEIKDKDFEPKLLLNPIEKSINHMEAISEDVGFTINELLSWQRVLGGLATVGISSAVFGHETESSISQFKGSTNTARLLLTDAPPDVEGATEELDKAIKHSKKIEAWGAYTLTRVQREKRSRRRIPILNTIKNVIKELEPAFNASSISLSVVGENFVEVTYPMDIESILVNLLTNAYTASLLNSGPRKILVEAGRESYDGTAGYFFSVDDTGPGIAKEFENRIFEPLFSTKNVAGNKSKSVGTGLGLTIVKSIVGELGGQIQYDKSSLLSGAHFKIWLPKST